MIVSHKWLNEVLSCLRIPNVLICSILPIMEKWRSSFSIGKEVTTEEIVYRRGLPQGDSLSPLLFCISIAPISSVLAKTEGYIPLGASKVIHTFFMDDLKIYAEDESALNDSLKVVKEVSVAAGMNLGLEKCAKVVCKDGNIVEVDPDTGSEIKLLDQKSTTDTLA